MHQLVNRTMDKSCTEKVLDINFKMLKYSGVWRPQGTNNKLLKFIYNLYTFFIMLIVISLTLQKFFVISSTTSNLDDLIDHLFPFVEILCIIVKGLNFLLMQDKIELAIQMMINNGLYKRPINQSEEDLKTTTDKKSRFVTA